MDDIRITERLAFGCVDPRAAFASTRTEVEGPMSAWPPEEHRHG